MYRLPWSAPDAIPVGFDPAFERRVGFTQLVVRSSMHRDGGRTCGQRACLDCPFALRHSGNRHPDLEAVQPRPCRQVACERPARNRETKPLRVRKRLAETLTDRVRDLVASGAQTNEQDVLRGQLAALNRQRRHRGSPKRRSGNVEETEAGPRCVHECGVTPAHLG